MYQEGRKRVRKKEEKEGGKKRKTKKIHQVEVHRGNTCCLSLDSSRRFLFQGLQPSWWGKKRGERRRKPRSGGPRQRF